MKKSILTILAALALSISGLFAQDPHFSQFYATPLYTNPALAGSLVCPRVSIVYRNQWPSIQQAFRTPAVSYDQYFDALSGGIGVFVMSDAQSEYYRTNMAALMYSLRLKITKDVFLNLAVQGSITSRSLDWDKLHFGDEIDPRYGFIYTSMAERPSSMSRTFFDVGAGLVVYGEQWYVGFAAHNLTQPNDGYLGYNRIPIRWTAHAGMNFNISRDARRTNAFFGAPIISPNVIYDYQNGFQKLNLGLYLDWSPFIVGAWLRHPLSGYEGINGTQYFEADAIVLLFGAQWEKFKLGYSYDITVSGLSNASGGAHEISLSYQFPCPEKHKKVKSIKCPSF
ncbi:MAG: type IX secretion system membrane protein PorP/SprF [Bacteroidales bacterium]|jgi:type IX secretion system PorP/SprF family membrane protein|nr:type IX secretion system membrane protein PorP/SprF [Bacteroidales bacterium]